MQTAQIIEEHMQEEVFNKIPARAPKKLYALLCGHFPLEPIRNKKHHEQAMTILINLSEFIEGRDVRAARPQYLSYMEVLGTLVEEYEKKHFDIDSDTVTGAEMLKFLMDQHELGQGDFEKEIGKQPYVSDILSGRRKLNEKHIAALSKRFGVSPSVFFPVA